MTEWVYLIAEEGSDNVKIGLATNRRTRLASLQTGTPRKLRMIHSFMGDREFERAFHEGFSPMSIGREWYADPTGLIYDVFETFAEAEAWGDEYDPGDLLKQARWAVAVERYIIATGDENLDLPDVPAELRLHPHGPFADRPNSEGWLPLNERT